MELNCRKACTYVPIRFASVDYESKPFRIRRSWSHKVGSFIFLRCFREKYEIWYISRSLLTGLSFRAWFVAPPQSYLIWRLDRPILYGSKLVYLATRIILRILTGKKNRDQAYFIRRFREIIGLSPSFYLVVALTGVIRAFKVSWPALVKVKVPKYRLSSLLPNE